MLVEGLHYGYFPKKNDVLAIFYAPVNLPIGKLPNFKTTSSLPVSRLLINPGSNNFYQDCLSEVDNLIERHSANYTRILHYGYSAGAYAALRFGLKHKKTEIVFAMSPHLNLKRSQTRSERLCQKFSEHRDDWDLVNALDRVSHGVFHLFISCCDVLDGAQVRDASRIENDRVHRHFYNLPHHLPAVHRPDFVISSWLDGHNCYVSPDIREADLNTQIDSVRAYDLSCAPVLDNELDLEEMEKPLSSNCGTLAFWQARFLDQAGHHLSAFHKFSEALRLLRQTESNLGDILFCMGNCMQRLGMNDAALGFYKEATLNDRQQELAQRVLVSHLKRLGRTQEAQAHITTYIEKYGADVVASTMQHELTSQLS